MPRWERSKSCILNGAFVFVSLIVFHLKVLDEIILEEIRKATYYARAKTHEFVEFINKKSSSENKRELIAKTNELSRLEKRKTELNALFKRLYEYNILGKVTNEQFRMLSYGYNTEQ